MKDRIVFRSENKMFRIIESMDCNASLEDLKGDMFNPECCPEIDPVELKRQEKEFENKVDQYGVFGYTLERWNPEPDQGWEHVDSCFGFIGQYDPKIEEFNHEIVEELKGQAK